MSMTHKNIKDFSELCKTVINFRKTGYSRNKKFITEFFTKKLNKGNVEHVRRRLILIDTLYSTNMSRRLYGIDELAKEISRYSDQEWRDKFKSVLKGGREGCVYNLFKRKYGRKKNNAKPAARCFSLISKYAYFLCNFEFPIYDWIVQYYFKDLLKEIIEEPERRNLMPREGYVHPKKFIKCLRYLREKSGLSYEEIDYILWTYGKLQEPSLSLIVTGEEYGVLIKGPWFKKPPTSSFKKARDILSRIKSKRKER